MAKEMILKDGQWVCPKCKQRKFRQIKNSAGYTCYIKDYDIAPEDKRDIGEFKFVYVCDNCNINIVEYDEMKRRL